MGARLAVAHEAPQGRRVKAIGAHFTHGPEAGRFAYQCWASLPKSRAKKQRKTPAQLAAAHGLGVKEVGPISSERLLAFIWRAAGRAAAADAGWQREHPLVVVLDNYSGSPVKLVLRVDFAPEVGRRSRDQREIGAERPTCGRFRGRLPYFGT